MKKTMLVLFAIFVVLAVGCSEAPSEPPSDTYTLTSPPKNTGSLQGRWVDKWDRVLSSQGLYDPHIKAYLEGELRVNGNTVWYQYRGDMQQYTFIGEVRGNLLTGLEQMDNWTQSQGVTFSWPPIAYSYTRQ